MLDYTSQFDMRTGSTFNTIYDTKSIMQYDEYAFSKNGLRTMIPLDGLPLIHAAYKTDDQILTSSDISAVLQQYQCTLLTTTTTTMVTTTIKPIVNTTISMANTTTTQSITTYSFQMTNDMSYAVNIYWYSNTNVEVLYYTLQPGSSYIQEAYKSNKWIVRTNTGLLLATFVIGEGNFTSQKTILKVSELNRATG